MAYEVQTEVFEGPFDLLLHLILREQVDLYEVRLSRIVDAYLIALFSAYLAHLLRRVEIERRRTAAISRETRALYAVAQSVLESPPEVEALYAQTVAAVRRHLSLPGFGIYAVDDQAPPLVAGYGVPAALPPVTLLDGADGAVRVTDSPVMMLDLPVVELKHQNPVGEQPFVLWAAVVAV